MFVGILTAELHVPESGSLKGKRSVVKGLKDRIGSRFNVSVAEVGETELWQRATLGVAVVSNDRAHADEVLAKVVDLIRSSTSAELLDYQIEIV
ncbi:MAG: DUF503 domain-containing protein [Nitrospirae bacterium]|nr:DUF503 domain-containing protein [Nitrospirota bacterium]